MSEPQDYSLMISRHIDRLLSVFPHEKVDRVLRLSGLTLGQGGVIASEGGQVCEDAARRYKEAIRQVFGDGVYAMARVSFIQGGCRCEHCREKVD